MGPSKQLPPLPSWPAEAFTHEPAHGYLVRLAAANYQRSVITFSDALGLNGRNFDPLEILQFCKKIPMRGFDLLEAGTPRLTEKRVTVNGVSLNRLRDWSIQQPRVCAACIAENRYYRNWWDVAAIFRCPIHDEPLVGRIGETKLGWWVAGVGYGADGVDIAQARARTSVLPESWDRYLLGRMNVVSPLSVPSLDPYPVSEIIPVVELLGRAAVHGWGEVAPVIPAKFVPVREVYLSTGFGALRSNVSDVVALLRNYMESDPCAVPAGERRNLGWFSDAARPIWRNLGGVLKQAADEVRDTYGLPTRAGRQPTVAFQRPIALKPLADELGISHRRLHRVADACGLLHAHVRTGVYHSFDEEAVSLIKSVHYDLILQADACKMLGITNRMFHSIKTLGLLQPFLNKGSSGEAYRGEHVRTLLDNLQAKVSTAQSFVGLVDAVSYAKKTKQTVASVLMKLLDGKLLAQGWDEGAMGIRACLIPLPKK